MAFLVNLRFFIQKETESRVDKIKFQIYPNSRISKNFSVNCIRFLLEILP